MKKIVKIIEVIIGIIILLGIIFFAIDYNRAKNNEQPMFCVQIDNDEIKKYNEEFEKKQYLEEKNISSIEIKETGLSSEKPAKSYTLNQDEMYELAKLIDSLTFSEETCDGMSDYFIVCTDEQELKSYGIELYSDTTHITSAGAGEAVLNDEQREQVNELLKNLEA